MHVEYVPLPAAVVTSAAKMMPRTVVMSCTEVALDEPLVPRLAPVVRDMPGKQKPGFKRDKVIK